MSYPICHHRYGDTGFCLFKLCPAKSVYQTQTTRLSDKSSEQIKKTGWPPFEEPQQNVLF